MSEAADVIGIVLDLGRDIPDSVRQTLELALAEIERLRRERDQYKALVEPAYRDAQAARESWSILAAWAEALLDERNDARRWARRLYRAAEKARDAIRKHGKIASPDAAHAYWRWHLDDNLLDAHDVLDKALGGKE